MEQQFSSEIPVKKFTGIHFEPGAHPMPPEYDQIFGPLNDGKLVIRGWHDEVLERIKTYKAEVLAIDGMAPSYERNSFALSQNEIWFLGYLPGRPKDINPSGEIYIVNGDAAFPLAYSEFFLNKELGLDTAKITEHVKKINDSMVPEAVKYDPKEIIIKYVSLALLINSGLIVGGMKGKRKDLYFGSKMSTVSSKISRRRFLQGLGVLTLSSLFGFTGYRDAKNYSRSQASAAFSKTKEEKNYWLKIAKYGSKYVKTSNFVDGRTALLISKEQDAIDYLKKPSGTPGAVILGYTHSYQADELMNSSEARAKKIAAFAEEVISAADHLIEENYPELDKAVVYNAILDYIAATDIIRVTDIDASTGDKVGVQDLSKMMSIVGKFQSPQVLKATEHLRR